MNQYQKKILEFMNPKTLGSRESVLMNGVLGLVGEAGEVADLIKKWCYHDHELDQQKVIKEIGDILFYVALTAVAMQIDLADVAQQNIDKLTLRYPNGFNVEDSKAKKDEVPVFE